MLYRIVKALVRGFMRVVFRVKVIHGERFPAEGPVIVSINHTSYWDVPLVAGDDAAQAALYGKTAICSTFRCWADLRNGPGRFRFRAARATSGRSGRRLRCFLRIKSWRFFRKGVECSRE